MIKGTDTLMYAYLESVAEFARDVDHKETVSMMMKRPRSNDDFTGQDDTTGA